MTSPKRLPQLPDVPAIAEVLPGYESSAWFGLFGPARMPPDVARRSSDAARHARSARPSCASGSKPRRRNRSATRPAEFARFVREDVAHWAPGGEVLGSEAGMTAPTDARTEARRPRGPAPERRAGRDRHLPGRPGDVPRLLRPAPREADARASWARRSGTRIGSWSSRTTTCPRTTTSRTASCASRATG